jgi:outer membrane protein
MKIVLALFLTTLSTLTFAQTEAPVQKLGYADFEYIFIQLPDSKQIESAMKIHGDQLKAQLDAKYKEYQGKVEIYQKLPATTLETVRRDKETELQQMQENIQKFQQDAQTSLQKKQQDLMNPVFAKVAKAIEAVAKENGYAYIFTNKTLTGEDVVLYSDPQYNVSALVLKKMGVTPAPVTPSASK